MAQQTTLRNLAKAYANGAIKLDNYRKSRGEFIEDVIWDDTDHLVIDLP